MVALQLLVVFSLAYRRPPPGTRPSRSHHPALPRRTPPAADLLSMVFRIRHPKPPGVDMPPERKPCLEHLQPPAPTPQSPPPGQRPCLSKPLPRLPRPSGTEVAHHKRAAKVLSMVFVFTAPKSPGDSSGQNQRPCLSELLLHRGHHRKRRGSLNNHTAHLISLNFWEMPHHNPPTGAANLISMVFRIHHPKPPGAGTPTKGNHA